MAGKPPPNPLPESDNEGEWHEQVVLPQEILRETPSRRAGVPPEVERRHRIFGCELIQEAGILLRQQQVVMVTAQNLLHRYYYRKALTNDSLNKRFHCDAFTVAMGALFLASKLEEKAKPPREVIFVFHHMCRKRRGLSPLLLEVTSTQYHEWREDLMMVERNILKELGFGFYNIMEHPHKFILHYVNDFHPHDAALAQKAWNYLNDSMKLDLCVRYRAELIACAAILMAARDLQVKLPDRPSWMKLFGANMRDVKRVCNDILSLYHEAPAMWLEPLHPNAIVSKAVLEKYEGRTDHDIISIPASSPTTPARSPTPLVTMRPDQTPQATVTIEEPKASEAMEVEEAAPPPESAVAQAEEPKPPASSRSSSMSSQGQDKGRRSVDASRRSASSRRKGASRSRSREKKRRKHRSQSRSPARGRDSRGRDDRDRRRDSSRDRGRNRERDRGHREKNRDKARERGRDRGMDRDRDRRRDRDRGRGHGDNELDKYRP